MKAKVYVGIALHIIIVCLIGMFWTYIPEQLVEFFDDKVVEYNHGDHSHSRVEWGARHIWYAIMMALLTTLTVISSIVNMVRIVKKNYDTSNW